MGGEPVLVDEGDRAAYADAIGTAAEFSRSIVEQATGILAGIGFERPGAYLGSLIRSTVDEALRRAGGIAELELPDFDLDGLNADREPPFDEGPR
jgi:predicted short-subunit dehydrogenase-like oxidoreductase (DUF2520 family)